MQILKCTQRSMQTAVHACTLHKCTKKTSAVFLKNEIDLLCNEINEIDQWCNDIGMVLNHSKCKTLVISFAKDKPNFQFSFSLYVPSLISKNPWNPSFF